MKVMMMKLRTLVVAAIAALGSTAALAASSSVVDFSNGMQGWFGTGAAGNTFSGIDSSLGNGSPAFHAVGPASHFAMLTNTSKDFLGNYTDMKSLTFSFDMTVKELAIGGPGGFPLGQDLVLELRDYDKRGPQLPYSSVWVFMGVIGGYAPASQHFSVTIADTSSNLLPAGWHGNGDADQYGGPTLPYGQTFRRILMDVDEVAITTAVPGFIYGAEQYYDVSIDNIALSAVPEPGQYSMMLAGLGLLGFTARRKRT
jgi:hypothetical protein